MRDFENFSEERKRRWEQRRDASMARYSRHGHVWTGLFLLAIGGIALIRSFGVPIPPWLFSWQMLLVAIGLFIGFRKGFRDGGWFVPVIIGGAFLLNDFFLNGELHRHVWPLVLVVIGVFFIFRSRNRRWHGEWNQKKNAGMQGETITPLSEESYSQDDFISTTCIFGSTKKVVLSKSFKGGDMVNVFGGAEIDLTQADINGTAEIEVTAIFGGATLIVPSNWAVKSNIITIFGGINDKRKLAALTENTGRTLVLKGTVIFGGVEIKSY